MTLGEGPGGKLSMRRGQLQNDMCNFMAYRETLALRRLVAVHSNNEPCVLGDGVARLPGVEDLVPDAGVGSSGIGLYIGANLAMQCRQKGARTVPDLELIHCGSVLRHYLSDSSN